MANLELVTIEAVDSWMFHPQKFNEYSNVQYITILLPTSIIIKKSQLLQLHENCHNQPHLSHLPYFPALNVKTETSIATYYLKIAKFPKATLN